MAAANTTPLPFEFVARHVSLDFTNTVSWGAESRSQERLTSYGQLLKWAKEARLPIDLGPLAQRAAAEPHTAARTLKTALRLRDELHEAFLARSRAARLPEDILHALNKRLAAALDRLELREIRDGKHTGIAWRVRKVGALDAPIHWIAWEAAALLASNERIKRCANPNCGWVFLDHSRRGNRRWCDMAVCGSRHKARTYYRRRKRRTRVQSSPKS